MKEHEGGRDRGGELLGIQISTQLKCKNSKQTSAAVTPASEKRRGEQTVSSFFSSSAFLSFVFFI